ncbi:TniQ family protein [Methylobacterium fujisawaense]|uniref:TniQ family protein n=1 Tax=Methylobacterium fujisawaense TaxID=107400 RepID=UPI002F357608
MSWPNVRLVVRSDPLPGEGLQDWALRLCELNHIRKVSRLLLPPDILWRCDVTRGEWISYLAAATGTSVYLIELLVGEDVGASTSTAIPGVRLAHKFFKPHPAKACPLCLREQPFSKAVWRLRVWTCCPIHGVYLVDSCPKCGKLLAYQRPGVDRCVDPDCDGRPSEASTVPASSAELELLALIARVLGQAVPPVAGTLSNVFGHLSAEQILSFVGWIGRRCANGVPDDTGIFRCAANILGDWPNGWRALINQDYRECNARDVSLSSRYPTITAILSVDATTRKNMGDAMQIIHDEFIRSICSLGGCEGVVYRSRRHKSNSTGIMISLREAGKILGVGKRTLSRMVDAGIFKTVEVLHGSGRVINYLYRSEVHAQAARLSELDVEGPITFEQCLKLLDTSRGVLRSLIDLEYICLAHNYSIANVSTRSLDVLYQKLDRLAAPMDSSFSVPIHRVCNGLRGKSITDILALMLSGTLVFSIDHDQGRKLRRYVFQGRKRSRRQCRFR